MKISQLINAKGNPVTNQFVIQENNATIFQSYSTIIAKVEGRQVYLVDNALDYSRTTTKHLRIFLADYAGINKTSKELRKMVSSGVIKKFVA